MAPNNFRRQIFSVLYAFGILLIACFVHMAESFKVTFNPPLREQRYLFVANHLEHNACRSILDLGCGPLKLLPFVARNKGLSLYRGVDISEDELYKGLVTAPSLSVKKSLGSSFAPNINVEILQGNIRNILVSSDISSGIVVESCLCGLDCCTLVEVLEHMPVVDAEHLLRDILKFLKIKLVIITTPNSDFNVLFPQSGFRHIDHYFELGRLEFQRFARRAADGLGYAVEFYGIGSPPVGCKFSERDIGCCTQATVFSLIESPVVPLEISFAETDNFRSFAKFTLMMTDDGSADTEVGEMVEAAKRRKERLAEMRNKSVANAENNGSANNANQLPKPTFRSYRPTTESLQTMQIDAPPLVRPEEQVKDQLLAAKAKPFEGEVDVTTLAPRKPDWDLKRDVAPMLEKLERRTNRKIAELIRERLLAASKDDTSN